MSDIEENVDVEEDSKGVKMSTTNDELLSSNDIQITVNGESDFHNEDTQINIEMTTGDGKNLLSCYLKTLPPHANASYVLLLFRVCSFKNNVLHQKAKHRTNRGLD
jgi:hypothetical protein